VGVGAATPLAIVKVTSAETPSFTSPVGSHAIAAIEYVPLGIEVVSQKYGLEEN
jgi:hypothetical protein